MKPLKKSSKKPSIPGIFEVSIYLIIGILIVFYIGYRAYNLSYTYDESFTFYAFVNTSFKKILTDPIQIHANNHLLNTILTRISLITLGSKEVYLRLPNVMAGVLYLCSAFKISQLLSQRFLRIVLFSSLVLNPFILDFFSLSRGYGLALGIMGASLACFTHWVKTGSKISEFGTLFFASLSVFAQYVMLNYLIPVSLTLILLHIIYSKSKIGSFIFRIRSSIKSIIPSLIFLLSTVLICLPRLLQLRADDGLYFGGVDNFWSDTIRSIVSSSLYSGTSPDSYITTIQIILLALYAAGVIGLIIKFKEIKITSKASILSASLLLLFSLSIVSTIVQHVLFGTRYLIERTAIFYIPLYLVSLIFMADFLYTKTKTLSRSLIIILGSLLLFFNIYNFVSNANFTYTSTWKNDAHTKEVVSLIIERSSSIPGCCTLSVDFWIHPSFYFYSFSQSLSCLPIENIFFDCTESDFVYDKNCQVDPDKYEVVQKFEDIGYTLYERKSYTTNE